MNAQDIVVDLSKRNVKPESIVLRQGDKNGTTLRVKVLDNGVTVSSLSGYTAKFVMMLPYNRFYYEVEGTITGSVLTFVIDETYAAVYPGVTNVAYVALENGEIKKVSANNIRVEILPSVLDGFTPPPAWTDPIDDFIGESQVRVDTVVGEANDAITRANNTITGITQSANQIFAQAGQATIDADTAAQSANTAATNANNEAERVANRMATIVQTFGEMTNYAEQVTDAAEAAAQTATTAAGQATTAAQSANSATSAANTAIENADNATARAIEAAEAAEGVVLQDVPLMSANVRGGAKLGAGLAIVNGALELDGHGDIATAVNSWLDAHPEATTTIQDDSITASKFADNAILANYAEMNTQWELGTINNNTGTDVANNSYIRTDYIPITDIMGGYLDHTGHYVYMYNYDSNKTFLQRRPVWLNTKTYVPKNYVDDFPGTAYVRFSCYASLSDKPKVYYQNLDGEKINDAVLLFENGNPQIESGYHLINQDYVMGTLSAGNVSVSYTRVTSEFVNVQKITNIKAIIKTSYSILINFYDDNKVYKTHSGWQVASDADLIFEFNVEKFGFIRYTIMSVNDAETIIPPTVNSEMLEFYVNAFSVEDKTESIITKTENIDLMKMHVMHIDEVMRGNLILTTGEVQDGGQAISKNGYKSSDYYSVENYTNDRNVYVAYYNDAACTDFNRYMYITPGQHLPIIDTYGAYFRIQIYSSSYAFFDENVISKVMLLKRGNYYLPDYWKNYINAKLPGIESHYDSAGQNGDTFIFITDTHWIANFRRSNSLIHEIRKRLNIKKVLFGGDVVEGTRQTKAEAIEHIRDFYKDFDYDLFSTVGNHDMNGSQNRLSESEVYSTQIKQVENYIDTKSNMYYYVDNPSQKIRYYMLLNATDDTGYHIDSEQEQFVHDTASQLDSTWSIVIMTHVYFNGYDTAPIESPLAVGVKAVIDDIATLNCELVCVLVGHCHYDYNTTYNSIPIIATQCDAPEPLHTGVTMTNGTTTEQCFDVVTIDKTQRKIFLDRIGAGQDRVFNY